MANLITRINGKARRTIAPVVAKWRNGGKAAVVGAGRIAPAHISAYQRSALVNVHGICDPAPAALARTLDKFPFLRAFRDIEQMLDEIQPQFVSICTWPQSHLELVRLAASRGVRGIMCEKPLALSMSDVNEMLKVCQDAGVKLAGGHQYRFHPMFVVARQMIERGRIGNVARVTGSIKSSIANNGPHLVDTIRFLLSDRDAVRATCDCFRTDDTFDRGIAVEQSAVGRIEFADDIQVDITTGDRSTEFFKITVTGTAGELEVTPSSVTKNGKTVQSGAVSEHTYRRQQYAPFIKWVWGRQTDYAANGIQSARSNELVLALYESARTNNAVELPLDNDGNTVESLYSGVTSPTAVIPANPALDEQVPKNKELAIDGGRRSVGSWFSTRSHIGKEEKSGVAGVLRSGKLNSVMGTAVNQFEKSLATTYQTIGAVASTSGTASIHVALGILGLEPGDEVITTPITDMGSIIPILWCNCVPVFADIDELTGNMTVKTIEQQITDRTRAVVLVHLFGRPANVVEIRKLLDERGIILIEDCSQAHFATVNDQYVGTIGDFGCFSLQQAKQITCGDGGFTLINNERYLRNAKLFVDKGWNRRGGSRAHEFLGMNYRMSEMQGAVALAQLNKLDGLIRARQTTANELSQQLSNVSGIVLPPDLPDARSSWWIYNFCIDEDRLPVSPDLFTELLQVEGVRVRRNYLPRPIFEEDVLQQQITYGQSGFPFSISNSPPPDAMQMPGLQEFMRRQMVIAWSSRVQTRHVEQIAAAVGKVAATRFATANRKAAESATGQLV